MTESPFVSPDVVHTKAAPVANGPNAVTQSGKSTASATASSPARSRQACGSVEMHEALSAFSRQDTMEDPVVVTLIAVVARHVAALPTANAPRAAVQAGIAGIRARPSTVERDSHGAGTVAHTEGVAVAACVGQSARLVTVTTEGARLKATWRHSKTLEPWVRALMAPVARQVAAVPTAKGPRAAVQRGMSVRRARPLEVWRLTQASGRVVGQLAARASVTQFAMLWPVVVREIVVERHVRTLPAA